MIIGSLDCIAELGCDSLCISKGRSLDGCISKGRSLDDPEGCISKGLG